MTRPLTGKSVAVIGGAHGIGEATARRLAARGAIVSVGDRDVEGARALTAVPGIVEGVEIDVTCPESITDYVDEIIGRSGVPDVVVVCAGVMWVGSFDTEPETALRRQIEVNLLGTIRCARAVLPRMVARGRGQLVSIASAASHLAPPGEASYTASKHGVLGYLTAVRAELRGTGVDISVVMPTVVDTELAAGTSSGAVRKLSVGQVAGSIEHAIRRPRFEITVPAYVDPLRRAVDLLPRRVRDATLRAMVPDQVQRADPELRRAYQDRTLEGPGTAGEG